MSSNIAGLNNPLLHQTAPPNFQAARSLDAVSQAQAILAAHALAQNLPSDYNGRSGTPLSPMPLQARHHPDGNTGTINPLSAHLTTWDLQNAMRSLDSRQVMSQFIASIQQLEMRCANAKMKSGFMMAQATHVSNAKAKQKLGMGMKMKGPLISEAA